MPGEDATKGVRPLTSVELLDAAIWREIGSEEPQPAAAFVDALSTLVGRWLLVRSDTPDMDAITLICQTRGCIERGISEQKRTNFDAPEWARNAFDEGVRYHGPR